MILIRLTPGMSILMSRLYVFEEILEVIRTPEKLGNWLCRYICFVLYLCDVNNKRTAQADIPERAGFLRGD